MKMGIHSSLSRGKTTLYALWITAYTAMTRVVAVMKKVTLEWQWNENIRARVKVEGAEAPCYPAVLSNLFLSFGSRNLLRSLIDFGVTSTSSSDSI